MKLKNLSLFLLVLLSGMTAKAGDWKKFFYLSNGQDMTVEQVKDLVVYDKRAPGMVVTCNMTTFRSELAAELGRRGITEDFNTLYTSGRLTRQWGPNIAGYKVANTAWVQSKQTVAVITDYQAPLAYNYICVDGAPIIKANCGNLENLLVVTPDIPVVPVPTPTVVKKITCVPPGYSSGIEVTMGERSTKLAGQYSIDKEYWLADNGTWFKRNASTGKYDTLCPAPKKVVTPTNVVVIHQDKVIFIPCPSREPICEPVPERPRFTLTPFLSIPPPTYFPPQQQGYMPPYIPPMNICNDPRSLTFGQPGPCIYPRQDNPWTNSFPFDGGNPNFSNQGGQAFDGGQQGQNNQPCYDNQGRIIPCGNAFDGGGRIEGIHERVF